MTRLATPIFENAHPINCWSAFNCYDSASTCKNQFIPFVHSSDRVNFRVPSHDCPNPFWTTPTPKIFNVLLTCMDLYQHAKKSVNSWDTVNFRVQRPDLLNLLWRNSPFRNYAIWLADSILAYISGTRFFPNIGFVLEHSK